MLDRLVSFLKKIADPGAKDGDDADDPRVAIAALMYHVIDADGVRDRDEADRLRSLIAQTYDLHGAELDAVLAAGESAEREAIDLYTFTSVVMRHLDKDARLELIGLLWEMVYADGDRHELEDNVVWRVAELIGIDAQERVAMRQRVAARVGRSAV